MALRNVTIVVTECQVSIVGAQCQAQWPQGRERILETSVMWRFPTVFASGVLVLALFGGAIAGPLEDADRAYDRGDYDTAFSLWQSLADQGDASAQLHLGLMFDGGVGVKPDWGKAAEWYRKAAEQGNVLAQRDLAMAYDAGEGVPQDHTQAATWYRRAAEQRDADAQAALGEMYADGRGVLQDYVQAHMWFNLAASAGYHDEAAKARDTLTAKMTPAQIAEAQKMAREWKPK
jgi:TPR repeat protein